jgi:hypothetical protein
MSMTDFEDSLDGLHIRERAVLEMALADVDRALRMAEIRAKPLQALIDQLPTLLDDDDREQIIYRLGEVQLNDDETTALASRIAKPAIDWEDLPFRDKARADSILGQLIRYLPEPHSSRIALSFLTHRRKRRREIAYKILRDAEIPGEMIEGLIALAESTDDQELLHLVARKPRIVAAFNDRVLIEKIEDDYWRMRVIEALLREEPERAIALASTYPILFVHAVGRLEAQEHRPLLQQLFGEHRGDPEFLSIYAWVLGRFADVSGLREVRTAMIALRKLFEERVGT